MGSSNRGINDDSATISDDSIPSSNSNSETDTDDRSPPSASRSFDIGEKVLAFHNKHVYEAKVKKVEYRMREWCYFVHYLGWSKNWDEWVGAERLMQCNSENMQKHQVLNKKQGTDKATRVAHSFPAKQRSSGGSRGKKRKSDAVSKEDGEHLENLMNLKIPSSLKKQLVDDCSFITHMGKLVRLPCTPNVDDILKKFLDYKLKKDGCVEETISEIVEGLRCYFNKALRVMLLYRSEWRQYDEATRDVSPSMMYGAEHMLRLFVKLPELFALANIDKDTLAELQIKLTEFLKFLQKNQGKFFLSTYHNMEDGEASTNRDM